MVNKDILGGLKVALSRGDSLQSAMQSFYNAGYTKEEIEELLRYALQHVPAEKLWVNPDCGLKTRTWKEVIPTLRNLAAAAKAVRSSLPSHD